MIDILIAKVFNTRNMAHIEHLKTKSYAQHTALNEFYDAVVGDIDKIVEVYQGAFGIVDIQTIPEMTQPANFLKHLEKEVIWITDNQKSICKGISAISNLVDNLAATYFSTIYKLKNLA